MMQLGLTLVQQYQELQLLPLIKQPTQELDQLLLNQPRPFQHPQHLGTMLQQPVIFNLLKLMPLLLTLLRLMPAEFVQEYIMKDHQQERDFQVTLLA